MAVAVIVIADVVIAEVVGVVVVQQRPLPLLTRSATAKGDHLHREGGGH